MRCYWEKVDGIKLRRKLRIRPYETPEALTDDTPVFVEIKQRVDRVTQKRRLPALCDALRLCDEREIPAYTRADRAVIEEIQPFCGSTTCAPRIVRYKRQAFIGASSISGCASRSTRP